MGKNEIMSNQEHSDKGIRIVMKLDDDNVSLAEAEDIFLDMKDFFESPEKLEYLTAIISKDNVDLALKSIEKTFMQHEKYEKCSQVQSWRTKLKEK